MVYLLSESAIAKGLGTQAQSQPANSSGSGLNAFRREGLQPSDSLELHLFKTLFNSLSAICKQDTGNGRR